MAPCRLSDENMLVRYVEFIAGRAYEDDDDVVPECSNRRRSY